MSRAISQRSLKWNPLKFLLVLWSSIKNNAAHKGDCNWWMIAPRALLRGFCKRGLSFAYSRAGGIPRVHRTVQCKLAGKASGLFHQSGFNSLPSVISALQWALDAFDSQEEKPKGRTKTWRGYQYWGPFEAQGLRAVLGVFSSQLQSPGLGCAACSLSTRYRMD